ncbi:hypothetical protein P3T36_005833 [Kitasatospora sp. MAP12-15]|uniref:hypothetical protein n=1 Tax=unclassified Kitasatospora TaxID=2633591 RepID=UPI0024732E2C|nr:hypothetical protein [Kitasatospora sp. MAP12-44]MDH6110107.1 hypothetical protein [Kitasatospora sp. MAP12-44]
MVSWDGLVTLAPPLLALLTAVATLIFVPLSQAPPTVIADKSQVLLAWTSEPVSQLDAAEPNDFDPLIARIHQDLDRRAVQVGWCLQKIQGHQAPPATVPGITCASATVPWWRTPQFATLVTVGIALVTAMVSLLALRSRYGFQKRPEGT